MRPIVRTILVCPILLLATTNPAHAEPLRILTWNTESGGADPNAIADRLSDFHQYHIIALQEISAKNFELYGQAVGRQRKGTRYLTSKTGRGDRLMIIYDSQRLSVTGQVELHEYKGIGLNTAKRTQRSPLVCRFLDIETNKTFIFLTVHLAHGNSKFRQQQARGLRELAGTQALPIVAAGDFNCDINFVSRTANKSAYELVRGRAWQWVQPRPFIDTNWADFDGDGADNYPDSILDAVFVANAAKQWPAECRVIVEPEDFPDGTTKSDHRPVAATFALE